MELILYLLVYFLNAIVQAPVVDTNANGITLEQGPVEGSNGLAWTVGGGRKRGPARRVVDTNSV